jgi:hypothetical protein
MDKQLDLTIRTAQQSKQGSSFSSEKLKLELENKNSTNCDEPTEKNIQNSKI